MELVLEHASDGAASPATALSGEATGAWPAVQASDRPPVKHQQPEGEYREAWESVERDKLSGAVLSVRGGLLPKPELNSSGGGSDMGKA